MSKTNQVCMTCTQRDTCQYYDPNRTICVPVMTEQEMQQQIAIEQGKVNALRQEVAEMNKDREYWQHYRIKAAIAAMQGMLANPAHQKVQVESGEPFGYFYAMNAIMCADVLIGELKKGGQDGK